MLSVSNPLPKDYEGKLCSLVTILIRSIYPYGSLTKDIIIASIEQQGQSQTKMEKPFV